MKIVSDSAFWIGVGRSFHQSETVNENVLESYVGITRHCSLADLRLLEGRGANMGYAVSAVHRGATRRGAPLCQNKSLKIVFIKAFTIFEK